MSKLKVELYNVKNVLLGRIIEQDEELRGITIHKKDGWEIQSREYPSLDVDGNILFVRGSITQQDDNWFSGEFGTEQEALEIAQILKEMVEQLNEEEKPQEVKLNKII